MVRFSGYFHTSSLFSYDTGMGTYKESENNKIKDDDVKSNKNKQKQNINHH